jgi:hypothetical protein
MTTDAKIQDVALRYIREATGDRTLLPFESIGTLHPALSEHFSLEDGELVLCSAFFSNKSWYVFTTRRIVSMFGEEMRSLDPSQGVEAVFPNFKGHGPDFPSDPPGHGIELPEHQRAGIIARDIASIKALSSGAVIHFEYETCRPSDPPMEAVKYWERRHRILDRLMTTAELQHYKRNIAVSRKRRQLPDAPAREQAQWMVRHHVKGIISTLELLEALRQRTTPESLPDFMSEFTPEIHAHFRQDVLPKYGPLLDAMRDWYGRNAG